MVKKKTYIPRIKNNSSNIKSNFNNSSNFELSQFLNENIKFPEFLVIDEKGKNLGLISKEKALEIAGNSNLDLFCITPNANPPVCKILDSSKYFYKIKKNNTKSKKRGNSVKEAKFSFRIGENDLEIKVQKIVKWLNNDDLVKVILTMWGREQKHKDIALEKCNRIIKKVQSNSSQFQLKDEIKLIGNIYNFTIFKNKKVSINKNEK